MPITAFHSQLTVQTKVDDYTRQKDSIETRVENLKDTQANIQSNPSLAGKFSKESNRAANQLAYKNKSAGYLRQRNDGSPRLTRHMGLTVRATRMIDGLCGSNLSAKSSMLDGGFRNALRDAERLHPDMRAVVDSPYKKMTPEQFAGIGNNKAITENLAQQSQDLNVTLEKLQGWKRLLKEPVNAR